MLERAAMERLGYNIWLDGGHSMCCYCNPQQELSHLGLHSATVKIEKTQLGMGPAATRMEQYTTERPEHMRIGWDWRRLRR